jgi:anti-sigma factor RsiW
MGMQCPIQNADHAEILLDYCARKLSPKSLAEVEQHLENCPECQSFYSRQRAVWSALDEWVAEPVSEQFDKKLYARIDAFENRIWWKCLAGEGFGWRPALSVGAACAAMAVTLFINTPVNQPKVAPSIHQTTRTEAVEPEQLERTLEDLEMLKQLSPSNAQNL